MELKKKLPSVFSFLVDSCEYLVFLLLNMPIWLEFSVSPYLVVCTLWNCWLHFEPHYCSGFWLFLPYLHLLFRSHHFKPHCSFLQNCTIQWCKLVQWSLISKLDTLKLWCTSLSIHFQRCSADIQRSSIVSEMQKIGNLFWKEFSPKLAKK